MKESDLVSFVPMRNLGILKKDLLLDQERELKKVSGSYTYFADNDVLMAKITPCFENGKLGIAKNLKNRVGFGSSEFIVFRSNEELFSEYLFYFLYQEKFRDEGKQRMTGAVGHKRVSKEFVENYKIPLPPLPEQKRIVKILDEVFEKIEKAKENAKKNLDNSKELFEAVLQSSFKKRKGQWEEKSLGDKELIKMIDGDRGKNYPKKDDFLEEGFCLFMNTKNVRPNGFDFRKCMFINKEKDELLRKGKLKRDDLVLTTRGTIGNLGVYDDNVKYDNIRINSGMLIFRVNKKKILTEYLFEIFRSGIMKSQIKKYVSGAAQPQLPIKTLINFLIPVPKSINKQKQIVKKLDAFSEKTKKLEKIYQQKLNDLEELKKSVLKKAFNGEL